MKNQKVNFLLFLFINGWDEEFFSSSSISIFLLKDFTILSWDLFDLRLPSFDLLILFLIFQIVFYQNDY